jgi:type II secretory pathway predicted ATPase ExeA
MYNSYFGFSRSPFENKLDQHFLFLGGGYQEVLGALLYFIETKKGFAIVCGDVGTGKTMLINSFLGRLPDSVQPIMMLNPCENPLVILIHIAMALKIRINGNESVLELEDKVKKTLSSAKVKEKTFVLIIDEAHLLSDQTLEEIRLLSNIETPDQQLLQILLVGQYELSHRLDRPEMSHLRQRINVKRFLSPLNPEETIQYADHRLRQVGSSFAAVFEDQCRSLIFKLTSGCPRLINQLCDNALLIGMTEGRRKVTPKVLQLVNETRQADRVSTTKSSRARTYRGRGAITPVVVVAGSAVLLILLGIIATRSGWGVVNFQSVFQKIRAAIPFASGPPAPLVAKSEELQAARKPTQLGQSSEPEGAAAPSLQPSASPPKTAPLPEGFGRMKLEGPVSPGEPPALSLPGQSEMKPGSAGEPKLAAEIATKKEEQGKTQDPLPEVGGTPPAPPAPAEVPQAARQLIAQAGESLGRIANRSYPANNKLGLVALILANPEIDNENRIFPGQALYLPEINFNKETIRLKDQRFYAVYGLYQSAESLKKDTAWLEKKQVRFVIRDTQGALGMVVHRVFLGGYETEEELTEALKSVNLKSP